MIRECQLATEERVKEAIKEALSRYCVLGTSDGFLGDPPFRAPWFLIDGSTAEPEVNWPGELIEEYGKPQDAEDHKFRLVAQAAIEAYEKVTVVQSGGKVV